MKPHEVKLEDLQEWVETTEVVFASSTRERKRLTATPNGNLKVVVAGKVIWEGIQPHDAVAVYNSINEKYIDKTKGFKL